MFNCYPLHAIKCVSLSYQYFSSIKERYRRRHSLCSRRTSLIGTEIQIQHQNDKDTRRLPNDSIRWDNGFAIHQESVPAATEDARQANEQNSLNNKEQECQEQHEVTILQNESTNIPLNDSISVELSTAEVGHREVHISANLHVPDDDRIVLDYKSLDQPEAEKHADFASEYNLNDEDGIAVTVLHDLGLTSGQKGFVNAEQVSRPETEQECQLSQECPLDLSVVVTNQSFQEVCMELMHSEVVSHDTNDLDVISEREQGYCSIDYGRVAVVDRHDDTVDFMEIAETPLPEAESEYTLLATDANYQVPDDETASECCLAIEQVHVLEPEIERVSGEVYTWVHENDLLQSTDPEKEYLTASESSFVVVSAAQGVPQSHCITTTLSLLSTKMGEENEVFHSEFDKVEATKTAAIVDGNYPSKLKAKRAIHIVDYPLKSANEKLNLLDLEKENENEENDISPTQEDSIEQPVQPILLPSRPVNLIEEYATQPIHESGAPNNIGALNAIYNALPESKSDIDTVPKEQDDFGMDMNSFAQVDNDHLKKVENTFPRTSAENWGISVPVPRNPLDENQKREYPTIRQNEASKNSPPISKYENTDMRRFAHPSNDARYKTKTMHAVHHDKGRVLPWQQLHNCNFAHHRHNIPLHFSAPEIARKIIRPPLINDDEFEREQRPESHSFKLPKKREREYEEDRIHVRTNAANSSFKPWSQTRYEYAGVQQQQAHKDMIDSNRRDNIDENLNRYREHIRFRRQPEDKPRHVNQFQIPNGRPVPQKSNYRLDTRRYGNKAIYHAEKSFKGGKIPRYTPYDMPPPERMENVRPFLSLERRADNRFTATQRTSKGNGLHAAPAALKERRGHPGLTLAEIREQAFSSLEKDDDDEESTEKEVLAAFDLFAGGDEFFMGE